MKYALLIYSDPTAEASPEEMAQIMEDYYKFTNSINERGINLGGEALEPIETATTVRVRNDETLTTDGPFAETKEVLGGFYLIDVPDLPGSWNGSVEVRPVWDFENAQQAE